MFVDDGNSSHGRPVTLTSKEFKLLGTDQKPAKVISG